MIALRPIACLVVCLLSGTVSGAEIEGLRTWTNSDGRKIEASLVRTSGKHAAKKAPPLVTLKLKNGKLVSVPIDTLSARDQRGLAEWLVRNPLGIASPSPPYHWPDEFNGANSPKVEYVGFDKDRQAHLVRTAHFDLYCDERLSDSTVSKCVAVFDTIVESLDSLPMMLDTIPQEGSPRYQAILVAERSTYERMGGRKNSAGFFSPHKNTTYIPFKSLGIVKKGSNWVFDGKKRDFGTLVHELTHHSTSHWLGMPIWFQEGLAEYMEAMPYRSGRFLFTNPGSAVSSSIRHFSKTTVEDEVIPGGTFQMRHPRELLHLDHATWSKALKKPGAVLRNYASALVLTYFFMHEDGDGDGAHFIQWMHHCRAAACSGRTADYSKLVSEHLIRGRSDAELEDEIRQAMVRRGLRLTFDN